MKTKKHLKKLITAFSLTAVILSTSVSNISPYSTTITTEAASKTTIKTTTKTKTTTKKSGNKKITTKKTIKTTVKTTKQKQKKKAKKTYTTKAKTTKNKTKKSSCKTVNTKVTCKYKYKNGSKTREKIETTVVTTTKVTTTEIKKTSSNTNTSKIYSTNSSSESSKKGYVSVESIAPKSHTKVKNAFVALEYKVYVDPSVNFSGKFSAKDKKITVRTNSDEAIYHELGHFLGFISGNMDTQDEFKAIYNAEKSKFTATRGNRSYIISKAEEYYAESYQDYLERPSVLKSQRPKTYAYIEKSLDRITERRINTIKAIYG